MEPINILWVVCAIVNLISIVCLYIGQIRDNKKRHSSDSFLDPKVHDSINYKGYLLLTLFAVLLGPVFSAFVILSITLNKGV